MGLIRLIEIFTKKVFKQTDNGLKVYFQDVDNLYPNRVKGLIQNSPTAFRSSSLMAKFIVGRGLMNPAQYEKIIDKTLKLDVYSFAHVLAKSIAEQNGFFVHVTYKIYGNRIVPAYSSNIPFEDCRISKVDDNGHFGRLLIKDWACIDDDILSSNNSNDVVKELYPFTKNQDELKEQILHNWKKNNKNKDFELREAIQQFKGHYYYYNPNIGDIYPLSKIQPVMNDCDTEYRIGNYTNTTLRNGCNGKMIVLTEGLTEEQEYETEKVFQSFLGDESASNMVFYPVESVGDGKTLKDSLEIIQIKPQYDEKFISETIPRVRRNIMAQFNNIPEALVMAGEGALFGTNSDTYNEMKLFYSEQNDEERRAVQKFFKDVYEMEVEFETFGDKIISNDK